MSTEAPIVVAKGLEGVVAVETRLSSVDGQNGILIYNGYDINDLAENATYEEVAFLLWKGHLPNQSELDTLNAQLQAERDIPTQVLEMLQQTPKDANPMAVLRTAVSMLAHFDAEADDMSPEANYRKSIRMTAKIPTILAAYDRIRNGKEVVAPMKQGSLAYDFLYMLNGEAPGKAAEKIFDVALVLHADHGSNASTYAARVAASTLSDIYSAVVAAIGTLKGPLHGGANIGVMKALKEIDETGVDVETWVKDKLAQKAKIMGFGHRVYRTLDPRAKVIREMLEDLSDEKNDRRWYEMQVKMMEVMKKEKDLNPNVDFFSAPVYHLIGLDTDLFTPIFALSRVAGWTAHVLEQWEDNKLIRPKSLYSGPKDLKVIPIAERA